MDDDGRRFSLHCPVKVTGIFRPEASPRPAGLGEVYDLILPCPAFFR